MKIYAVYYTVKDGEKRVRLLTKELPRKPPDRKFYDYRKAVGGYAHYFTALRMAQKRIKDYVKGGAKYDKSESEGVDE